MTDFLRARVAFQGHVPPPRTVVVYPPDRVVPRKAAIRQDQGRFIDTSGTTTQGLQEAADDLASTGGQIRLTSGTYTLTGTLDLPSNVDLVGSGSDTVLTNGAQLTDGIVRLFEASDVTVANLKVASDASFAATPLVVLESASSGEHSDIALRALELDQAVNDADGLKTVANGASWLRLRLEDLAVVDSGGGTPVSSTGVLLDASSGAGARVWIWGLVVDGFFDGLKTSGTWSEVYLSDGDFSNAAQHGARLDGIERLSVSGSVFALNAVGLYLNGQDHVISGCTVTENTSNGIEFCGVKSACHISSTVAARNGTSGGSHTTSGYSDILVDDDAGGTTSNYVQINGCTLGRGAGFSPAGTEQFGVVGIQGTFSALRVADCVFTELSTAISAVGGSKIIQDNYFLVCDALNLTLGTLFFRGNTIESGSLSGGSFDQLEDFGSSQKIKFGSGSPNGVVTADPGSLFLDKGGGAGSTLWVKESGTGNTGWVAK